MKKSEKKSLLAGLFGLVAIYLLLVVFVPYSTATNVFVDHFTTVKSHIVSDVYFYGILIVILGLLYWFLIYRPKRVGKGRKAKDVSMARKVFFALVFVYAILLVVLPYVTLPATAAQTWVTVFDHFIAVKDAIISDFGFLLLAGGGLGAGYYFLVYKPKV